MNLSTTVYSWRVSLLQISSRTCTPCRRLRRNRKSDDDDTKKLVAIEMERLDVDKQRLQVEKERLEVEKNILDIQKQRLQIEIEKKSLYIQKLAGIVPQVQFVDATEGNAE